MLHVVYVLHCAAAAASLSTVSQQLLTAMGRKRCRAHVPCGTAVQQRVYELLKVFCRAALMVNISAMRTCG
jgi:hypothetical protein